MTLGKLGSGGDGDCGWWIRIGFEIGYIASLTLELER